MSDFDDTLYWEAAPGEIPNGPSGRGRRGGHRRVERTRTHHVVTSHRGDDAGGDPAGDWSPLDHWLEPESHSARSLTAIDPRLVRVGALIVAVVLAVPIALAMRSGPDDAVRADAAASTTTTAAAVTPVPATVAPAPPAAAASAAPAAAAVEAASSGSDAGASGAATVQRAKPACAGIYTVVPNDYWNRFPKSSGASVAKWLAANNATADTPLYVGDELCIPAGATAPAPPPVTAPSTSIAPATTQDPAPAQAPTPSPSSSPAPAAPTTAAPALAQPPASAAKPAVASPAVTSTDATPTAADPPTVEALIREIWPDDLEERALAIAQRESHLNPSAHNWCCYGVFAIYFEMGRNFLPQLGVTRAEQLLDARTNILAAYKLYTLAGWSPWNGTDPGS
jgi:LysM repeat protein